MNPQDWNRKAEHPLQSWEWGEFRSLAGNEVSRITGDHNYQIVWTKIRNTPWCFGYIPMGPMPTKGDLVKLSDEGKDRRAVGIRMEPKVFKGEPVPNGLVPGRHLFKPKTFWWHLEKSETELLEAMHPKCRYNIRLAQRHEVKIGQESNEEGLRSYLDLMFGRTTQRQKIYSHSPSYHKKMWEVLNKAGSARLWTAKYQGQAVAAWMIFLWKDTLYYAYGGFDDQKRQVMAPVLGLWEIARWGKQQGYKYFDLWGAEEGKGFSKFKEQFGASVVEMAGAFDLPLGTVIYPLFRTAEEIRWKMLRAIR